MNQTWEIDKKSNFGPNFGPFCPKLCPCKICLGFTSTRCCALLEIINEVNFKENDYAKVEKMTKILVSGVLILAPLAQI